MRTDHDQAQRPVLRIAGVTHSVAEAVDAGFARANGEACRGDVNVAAPLVRPGGNPVAAINISVPMARGPLGNANRERAPRGIETARALWVEVV